MSKRQPELIIISGGSEVVGLALADAANRAAIPYAVLSLVPHSLLRSAPGCVAWTDLSPFLGNQHQLRDRFLHALAESSTQRNHSIPILPTEDGSLRLLNEYRDDVLPYGEFSRARSLRMGGADKAEVVELTHRMQIVDGLTPSLILHEPSDALEALHAYGQDTIFKPALKPLDMDLSDMGVKGTKVVTRSNTYENPEQLLARLRKAWPLSERWIAQPRLTTGADMERSVCAVRNESIRACQVVERAKYPYMGGTAYWVSIDQSRDLVPTATHLLDALDVVGICELSYLPDAIGVNRMIEFNPRPWLQVDLVERAGFPIVSDAIAALSKRSISNQPLQIIPFDWIQPERALLSTFSGKNSLHQTRAVLACSLRQSTTWGGYSSKIPGARGKLVSRLLRKAFHSR